MYCQYCGKEVGDTDEFCAGCGAGLIAIPFHKRIYRHELTRLKPIKEPKSPGAAAALGFILGWIGLGPIGYIYLRQWNWFWITFIIEIIAIPITLGTALIILPFIFAFHQYDMAKELNELLIAELDKAGVAAETRDSEGPTETYNL
jgi:hypothetical protein